MISVKKNYWRAVESLSDIALGDTVRPNDERPVLDSEECPFTEGIVDHFIISPATSPEGAHDVYVKDANSKYGWYFAHKGLEVYSHD